MDLYIKLIEVLFPVFFIIGIGYLLGKKNQCPIFELLGYKKSIPKIAYASVLFGKSPNETFKIAKVSFKKWNSNQK